MRIPRAAVLAAIAFVISATSVHVAGQEPTDVGREEIVNGLQQRSASIAGLAGLGVWAKFYSRHSMTDAQGLEGNRAVCAYRFTCDRQRWRYEVKALITNRGAPFDFRGPYQNGNVLLENVYKLSAYDGNDVLTYDGTIAETTIENREDSTALFLRFPLREFLLFGWHALDFSKLPDNFDIDRATETVDGHECYVVFGRPPGFGSAAKLRLWVCPALGYAVTKAVFTNSIEGTPLRDVWVAGDFTEVVAGIWMPKETIQWLLRYSPDEEPLLVTQMMRFDTIEVPDMDGGRTGPFHLRIPLGMRVEDDRSGELYYEGRVDALLSELGTEPPPVPEEYRVPPTR